MRPAPLPDGFVLASPGRRAAAGVADVTVFVLTLGIGWCVWSWRAWRRGTTPGKSMLGLWIYDTSRRALCEPGAMAMRSLVYRPIALLLGVATVGLGYLYAVLFVLGPRRQALYDDWARTLVLRKV